MKRAPILNPSFKWIPSSTHDADSTAFRKRQRARMAKAAAERGAATAKVTPIAKGRKA